jgi:hypothetical protein
MTLGFRRMRVHAAVHAETPTRGHDGYPEYRACSGTQSQSDDPSPGRSSLISRSPRAAASATLGPYRCRELGIPRGRARGCPRDHRPPPRRGSWHPMCERSAPCLPPGVPAACFDSAELYLLHQQVATLASLLIRRLCHPVRYLPILTLTCRNAAHWCAVDGSVERPRAAKMRPG